MPPKGFKKPEQTRCATCDKILPAIALRGVLRQLGEARAELDRPKPDGDDAGRFARFRILHLKGMLDILIEDEASFCFGHGAKPGPRPKAPPSDPSFPEDADTPKPKRRRLRAVQGDE
jgi:hypothetical protein